MNLFCLVSNDAINLFDILGLKEDLCQDLVDALEDTEKDLKKAYVEFDERMKDEAELREELRTARRTYQLDVAGQAGALALYMRLTADLRRAQRSNNFKGTIEDLIKKAAAAGAAATATAARAHLSRKARDLAKSRYERNYEKLQKAQKEAMDLQKNFAELERKLEECRKVCASHGG